MTLPHSSGVASPRTAGRPSRLHAVLGTRPEAVKIAPVALFLATSPDVEVTLVDTGQQPGRVAEALDPFGLKPDLSLGIERRSGTLAELAALCWTVIDQHLLDSSPDAVLVQGDTSTAFIAALTAYWRRTPIVHLEAGLRTFDLDAPFPEEGNRAMLARIASLHLAPTARAADTLASEGIRGDHVVVTGNTVVDALSHLLRSDAPTEPEAGHVTVTVHRREAWGDGVTAVCEAVRRTVADVNHAHFTVVAHPNPEVAGHLHRELDRTERVEVVPPLPYDRLLALLQRSQVVLTDSGGIQEEAPSLRLPALVAREKTERPEAVEAGVAQLVGLDSRVIHSNLVRLLNDSEARGRMKTETNPFGDGKAAERCGRAIEWSLGQGERPGDWAGG